MDCRRIKSTSGCKDVFCRVFFGCTDIEKAISAAEPGAISALREIPAKNRESIGSRYPIDVHAKPPVVALAVHE